MRLVCPNCGAQYEVDDRVIPETGRDVQCSACGHSWYQMPMDQSHEAEDIAEIPAEQPLGPDDFDESESEDLVEPEAAEGSAVPPEPKPAPAPEPAPEPPLADSPAAEPEPEPEPAEAPEPDAVDAPPRRMIDDSVRDILQREAQAELARRAEERPHEPEPVETQPDLGIDAAPSPDEERRRIARERMARMRGLDDEVAEDLPAGFEAAAEAGHDRAARRDLFPDIEEINSTLDSHDDGTGAQAATGGRERAGGFARGFFLVLLIAVLAMVLYLLAPTIAARVPALEPSLSAYVAFVNDGRTWLDEAMKGMIAKIEAKVQAGQ